MTDEKFFDAVMKPAIWDFDLMSDLDACFAIARLVHNWVDLSATTDKLLSASGLKNRLKANITPCLKGEGGYWCGDTALICAQALNASKRCTRAWYYSDGLPAENVLTVPEAAFTHAMTLFEVNGVLFHVDAYMNGEYLTDTGEHQPFLTTLKRIKAGDFPRWRQNVSDKNVHMRDMEEAKRWDEVASPTVRDGVAYISVTAERFRQSYYYRAEVDAELIVRGHPADPDAHLWDHLRLYPLDVHNSWYQDLDTSKDDVFAAVLAAVT